MHEVLVPVICNLCNASLQHGVFPTSLKQAIVLPQLKKNTLDWPMQPGVLQTNFESYPHLKSGWTNCHIQMVRHAEENQLFPVRQSSYRCSYSTETAMLCVHNDLVCAVDNKEVTALVLLDLSSAFDTVDHSSCVNRSPSAFWRWRVCNGLVHVIPVWQHSDLPA